MKASKPKHGKTKGEFLFFGCKNSYEVKRIFYRHIVQPYINNFGFHKKSKFINKLPYQHFYTIVKVNVGEESQYL